MGGSPIAVFEDTKFGEGMSAFNRSLVTSCLVLLTDIVVDVAVNHLRHSEFKSWRVISSGLPLGFGTILLYQPIYILIVCAHTIWYQRLTYVWTAMCPVYA